MEESPHTGMKMAISSAKHDPHLSMPPRAPVMLDRPTDDKSRQDRLTALRGQTSALKSASELSNVLLIELGHHASFVFLAIHNRCFDNGTDPFAII